MMPRPGGGTHEGHARAYQRTPVPAAVLDVLVQRLRGVLKPDDLHLGAEVARYTTWRVGGPAALLAIVRDAEALRAVVAVVRAVGVPWVVLGRGSNVLVADEGVDGVVIVNRAVALRIDGTVLWAESGVPLSVLARRSVGAGLAGLEWCHDIPGSVGGAVVNNAGANGGAVSDVLDRVRVLPAGPGTDAVEMEAAALRFGYRSSVLRLHADRAAVIETEVVDESGEGGSGDTAIVLDAVFGLRPDDGGTAHARLEAYRERRKRTQPGGASAGSVFKNPDGDSAGRLVESAGLKGTRHGDAAISTLHANFIVGGPHARAADVLALVAQARHRVHEVHGVVLAPEIQCVYPDGHIGPPLLED